MKKLLVLSFAIASALVSQAAYLYWQIDTADVAGLVDSANASYATAYLYNTNTHDKQEIGSTEVGGGMMDSEFSLTSSQIASGNYVFYVEVMNYDGAVIGTSWKNDSWQGQTYSALASNGSIVGTAMSVPTVAVWHGGGVAAPEPTSAMMILLGLAGLALKRKQV